MEGAECQRGRYLRLECVIVERRRLRADDALLSQGLDEYRACCSRFWCETEHVVMCPVVPHGKEVEATDACCRLVGDTHSVLIQISDKSCVEVDRFKRFDSDVLPL